MTISDILHNINSTRFMDVSKRALLVMDGAESLDLLHRISTNDFSNVPEAGVRHAILTNEKGRIVDKITALRMAQGQLLVACTSTDAARIQGWIEKFIIMEQITVQAVGDEYSHIILFDSGPQAFNRLELNTQSSIYTEVRFSAQAEHSPVAIGWFETFNSISLTHILGRGITPDIFFRLLESAGIRRATGRDFEEYRIRHGIPAHPNELSDAYNPLEARLTNLISFTKGCYIGQEVIARLDTYQKVQKHLARLSLSAKPSAVPTPLRSADADVGILTSAIETNNEVFGLGYLRTQLLNQNAPVFLIDGELRIEVKVLN